jgi:hypothetical protein
MALRKLSSEKETGKEAGGAPRGADRERVSAQELALAVATLEQRQAEAAHSQGETLLLDEAVRELGLPFSSREVWAEVQARRDRLAAEARSPSRFRVWMRSRKKAAGLALAAALLASAVAYGVQTQTVAEELAKNPVQHITLADVAKYEIVRQPTAHGVRLCTLAEVPEEATVIVNASSLEIDNEYVDQNTQNDTPERLPQASTDGEPSVWRIVKHDGRLYVRGWVVYDVSPTAARLSGITIYSVPTALGGDHRMLPLTLRATSLPYTGRGNNLRGWATGKDWQSLRYEDVRMDKHAGEKW